MKPLKIFLLFAMVFFVMSCTISIVPTRSETAIAQVQDAASATNNLYDDIIGSSAKDYNTYAAQYQIVNQKITDILVTDSARKKSGVILIIARDIQKRFKTYESEHQQAVSISNAEARTYKDYMHALFETLRNAEANFKPE